MFRWLCAFLVSGLSVAALAASESDVYYCVTEEMYGIQGKDGSGRITPNPERFTLRYTPARIGDDWVDNAHVEVAGGDLNKMYFREDVRGVWPELGFPIAENHLKRSDLYALEIRFPWGVFLQKASERVTDRLHILPTPGSEERLSPTLEVFRLYSVGLDRGVRRGAAVSIVAYLMRARYNKF